MQNFFAVPILSHSNIFGLSFVIFFFLGKSMVFVLPSGQLTTRLATHLRQLKKSTVCRPLLEVSRSPEDLKENCKPIFMRIVPVPPNPVNQSSLPLTSPATPPPPPSRGRTSPKIMWSE